MKLLLVFALLTIAHGQTISPGPFDGAIGGDPWPLSPPVAGMTSLRFGTAFSYTIPLPDGPYRIAFDFVEPSVKTPGARVFSVTANDAPIIRNLDVFAACGYMTDCKREAQFYVSGGALVLKFTTQVRSAVVSRITITPVASSQPAVGDQRPFTLEGNGTTQITIGRDCIARPCIVGPLDNSTAFIVPTTVNNATASLSVVISAGAPARLKVVTDGTADVSGNGVYVASAGESSDVSLYSCSVANKLITCTDRRPAYITPPTIDCGPGLACSLVEGRFRIAVEGAK